MTVYIVISYDITDDYSSIVDVYSTEEQAIARAEEECKKYGDIMKYSIEVWEVK